MSKKAKKYDITLRIKGGGRDGALGPDDLKRVIEFMTSVASQDDSLGDLCLVDVRPGSVEACFRVAPRPGSQGALGIYTPEERAGALGAVFGKPHLPPDVSESLRPWARAGLAIELLCRVGSGARPKKIAVDSKMLERPAPRPHRQAEKRWVTGRVVRLIKDEQEYGIETTEGVLLCPMDETKNSLYLDLYRSGVAVDVLASFPLKPPSGPWRARAIHEMFPQREPAQLPLDTDGGSPFDIENIPSIAKPKNPQTYGVSLAAFAAALTPEDGESLAAFLQEGRGR